MWPSPRVPFDPARLPFYYGWLIAAAGTAAVVMSIPGQTMGVSVFTDPLLEASGLSRLQFSNAYLIGTLSSGLLLPLGGRLLDRLGSRLIGAASCLVLAATLLFMSSIDRFAQISEGATGARAVGAIVVFALGFSALRLSGQGMLTLTGRTMLARWFDRYRGIVAATSGAVVSLSYSVAPIVLLAWIHASTWRGAWREMALVLLAMAAVALIVFRDRPEDCGLALDGLEPIGLASDTAVGSRRATALEPSEGVTESNTDFDRREALATGAFWILTLGISNQSLVGTALTFHILDLGAEADIASAAIVRIFLPISVVAVLVSFVVGHWIDRKPVLPLLRLMMVIQAVEFLAAAHLDNPILRAVTILFWGLAAGFYIPMTVAALPRLYGRAHLGAISGVMTMWLVIGSALGPAFLAFFRQEWGSYRPALYLCTALPLAVLTASVFIRSPTKPGD